MTKPHIFKRDGWWLYRRRNGDVIAAGRTIRDVVHWIERLWESER